MQNDDNGAMVIFQPSGCRGRVPKGISLLEAARLLGVAIEAPCGEKRLCGKCMVRIEQGSFAKYGITSRHADAGPVQDDERRHLHGLQAADGFRLGCAARVEGDLVVFVPEASRAAKQVVRKGAGNIPIRLHPAVRNYTVAVKEPAMEDPAADFERVAAALQTEHGLGRLSIDLFALRELGPALRAGKWTVTVTVWMEREIIRVRPGRGDALFGLAVDVGTTTVAAYLCNLATMEVVDTLSMMNPQCRYGEDVVSRISYHTDQPGALQRMSDDLIAGLNTLIEDACAAARGGNGSGPSAPEDIVDLTVCGNTAMQHILLQLDPEPLGQVPFTPAIQHSLDLKARDLGLRVNRAARVYLFPVEAGYVGGDNVAVIMAEKPHRRQEIQLIIDIGTNGELLLGNRQRLLSCSCATGPALEGAQIECGMRAAPGAIERVLIDPRTHEVDYKVVGRDAWRSYSRPQEMQARGICGSGILDVLAELYKAGIIKKSGAFDKANQRSGRLRQNPDSGVAEFVLAFAEETSIGRDIVITQKDIRQIQLAKAAIYTGCRIMMRHLGVDRIDRVKIAGAFGMHLDRRLALVMGLFPDCPVEIVSSVGNAAGDGCRAALLDRNIRREADRVCRRVEHLELTLEPDFQQQLIEAIHLPHMTDPFPHLDGIVAAQILNQP